MLVRLQDIHTFSEFAVPFEARWATIANGEVRIVMHRSQLEELAEEINTVLADLPAEADEDSRLGNTGAVATVLPAVRVEPPAAPNPIHEILRQINGWKGAA
jgi:hypothetical protein